MMLRSGTICKSGCPFCAIYCGSKYKEEDCTPEKKLKLEANADTHQALHEAIESHDCGTVSHLLATGEKLCSTDGIENCFILITKFYNSECVEQALTGDPSAIHCRGPQGQTLLMYAKHVDTIKALLKFEPNINACNDSGHNLLIHLIKENINTHWTSYDMFFHMAQFVLDEGINASATDTRGKTAIDYVLKFDKKRNCSDTPLKTDKLIEKLLKAGAPMPGADSFGRTPAMYFATDGAYMSHYFTFILNLLQQGVDPKARDKNGHNLMYYVIRSYYTAEAHMIFENYAYLRFIEDDKKCSHFHYDLHNLWTSFAAEISEKCLALLRYGCDLGGLDEVYDNNRLFIFHVGYFRFMRKVAKSVNIISLLLRCEPFSDFIKELPQYNLNLKKSASCISELTYYFVDYDKWPINDETFETVEATVTHLLACGVNVMQKTSAVKRHTMNHNDDEEDIFLTVPDALWFAAQILMKVTEKVRGIEGVKKPYYISCKILMSLLRFWNYPPLILIMFMYDDYFLYVDNIAASSPGNSMLKFLTRVGGRLPPGSPLFNCLVENLERVRNGRISRQHFNELHEEIPSLKELCRPVIRATISRVTTSGLDFSSLRVLLQGELRELPKEIEDFLNFKDQPVFCEEDLVE